MLLGKVVPIDINEEMRQSYLDYAMSVIVGRALPDVRDGLKPVHRRILYAMHSIGMTPDKPHRKSAYIVGEVLARYHPHGDMAVYDALVRLAQDFACRYPLVDGHGNFGSVDGDAPAAMRYTEARLSRLAMEMLRDIGKETVDFVPNYDGTTQEPVVLPARIPNLLINGSAGIAVGMATNIPPHNIGEVIDGVLALIDNPQITVDELAQVIPGPDFPTGGIILGREAIRAAYTTGRGSLVVRGRASIERLGGKTAIIVTEIPYQVNKARLLEKIAELVRERRIDGITDLRDESDRRGMRIVIEVRRDVEPKVILNRLYKHTQLEDTFGIIMLALVDGQPEVLNLKQMLQHYLDHQKEVVIRRCRYDLREARDRLEIVEGLNTALANIDAVIVLIKASPDTEAARKGLVEQFGLTERQAQAILDMRLQRLTGLEREKLLQELGQLRDRIAYLEMVLADEQQILGIIREELAAERQRFADPRRTEISEEQVVYRPEDLIPEEQVVVTVTHQGYIKRRNQAAYRSQHRGGRGITGVEPRQEDFVRHLFVAGTHDYFLFFTNKGKTYRLKVYEIPEAGRHARGTAIVNLIQMSAAERVTAIVPVKEFSPDKYVFLVTQKGVVKKVRLDAFASVRRDGIIAVSLDEGDELVAAALTDGKDEILLVTRQGKSIRFSEEEVRPFGRTARGVRGIRLRQGDAVAGMGVVEPEKELLVVLSKGYGKRTLLKEFRRQSRGGTGIIAAKVSPASGEVAGIEVVSKNEEVIVVSTGGILIRLKVGEIPVQGRAARGVVIMRLGPDDSVATLAKVVTED
ncbi:MAG: DNA gyrase subunit A [Bacillota bacterium]|nr:DNA gyrase subunit A [Thermoanaerobacteraceae bacterium]